jgi:hypothetical protein
MSVENKYKLVILITGVVIVFIYSIFINPMVLYAQEFDQTITINYQGSIKMMGIRLLLFVFGWYAALYALPALFSRYSNTQDKTK